MTAGCGSGGTVSLQVRLSLGKDDRSFLWEGTTTRIPPPHPTAPHICAHLEPPSPLRPILCLQQVRLLVHEGGANINVKDRWAHTPLDEARRVGATPVVLFLEERQASGHLDTVGFMNTLDCS